MALSENVTEIKEERCMNCNRLKEQISYLQQNNRYMETEATKKYMNLEQYMVNEEQKIEEIEKKRLQKYVSYLEDTNRKTTEDAKVSMGNVMVMEKLLYTQEIMMEN